jgi:hypothetical protein
VIGSGVRVAGFRGGGLGWRRGWGGWGWPIAAGLGLGLGSWGITTIPMAATPRRPITATPASPGPGIIGSTSATSRAHVEPAPAGRSPCPASTYGATPARPRTFNARLTATGWFGGVVSLMEDLA